MLWWTDDLRTGVESVDNQHKSIFEKANEIFSLDINSDRKKIESIFMFLMNYANNHFYEEEVLMVDNHYDDFVNHRREHNHFIEELYIVYTKVRKEKDIEEPLNELKILIIDWLINHINGEDKDFVKTLQREIKSETV